MDSLKLAFIGLGIMGLPMAGHLLKSGHALTVHTRTKSKANDLLNAGATWADTPAAAATNAEVIFICVTDTPDVEAILFGKNGVIESVQPRTIIVDHSTISPSATRKFARQLVKKNVILLDAPVSGGDTGAKNATLSIMVGGETVAFDRVLPLLQLMGKTITHCGGSGTGQLTKLVNQILVSVTNLAVSEAMTLAVNGGLDPLKTIQAVANGAAGSWQLSNLAPKMIAGDFNPGFMIDLQYKDLKLVLEAAKDANVHLNAVELVSGFFKKAISEGQGKQGTQALFEIVKSQNQ